MIIKTKNKEFIIDDNDFNLIKDYTWRISKNLNYVKTTERKTKRILLLHRLLLNAKENEVVDHINGNPLDNRRVNLRICTHSQNIANRFKKPGLSIYKGVSFDKSRKKGWMARLENKGKNITIGRFFTEKEAALAYNKKAIEIWGEFAVINDVDNCKQVRYNDFKYKGDNNE